MSSEKSSSSKIFTSITTSPGIYLNLDHFYVNTNPVHLKTSRSFQMCF